ncbi:MAG: sulfatase [Bacteroidota bacterium]
MLYVWAKPLVLLGILIFLGLSYMEKPLAQEPNIILITVDDLGWTDLGCFGSTYYETPHIDNLSNKGVRFTNAYAASAVCSPTRAAIQTGRYPSRTGITNVIIPRFQGGIVVNGKNPTGYSKEREGLQCPKNLLFLERDEVTIAELLKPLGYTTCHIGKWHLGEDDWYPTEQGYDFNIGGCDFGQPPSYFDPYKNKKLDGIPTLKPRKEGEYLVDREADEAITFIEKNKNAPFFLNWSPYAVHTPIQAKDSLIKKYETKPVTNQTKPNYAAMIESLDTAIGSLVACLDKNNLTQNTLIIFTSDNGGLLGPTHNAPLRLGKGFEYEGGIRIPQIFYWPGNLEAGKVVEEAVISMDIFPTIASATGAELPDREIDGESLWPFLIQDDPLKERSLFWHFPHFRLSKVKPYSIVRDGDWKLIKRHRQNTEYELYNLKEDVSEAHDLAMEMPEKVKELKGKLDKMILHTGAKLPIINTTP